MQTQTLKTGINFQQKLVSHRKTKSNHRITGPRIILSLVEILFGLQLGALLGWPIGWRLGAACSAIFEPSSLASPQQVHTWYYLPETFARYGLWTGVILGAVWAYCYSKKLLKKRVLSLYQQGQTEPALLAQSLGQTEHKIASILDGFARKGQIEHPKDAENIKFVKHFKTENTTMKRVNLICTITLMAFFLFGCLPSLHPIYTDDTVIFDEQLIGKWYADGGTWSFTKSGDKQYTLHIVEEDGKQATLDVHLVQLGEHTFIDLYPGENMELENTAEFYSFHLVPAHTFMKVELSEPNLNLQWVCLKDIIEDDPNRLKHERFENDSILITADSEDIQRVLLDNLDKVIEEDETTEFKRCPELFTVKNIVYDAELTGHWQADDGEYVDIIEWGHLGYDVIYSDGSQEVKKMKAVLYQRGHRTFLGLYVSAVCETQEKPETLLTPDFLAEIQLNESGLKIWFIDWSESEDWLDHNQKSAQGNIPEPNCLFRKTLL